MRAWILALALTVAAVGLGQTTQDKENPGSLLSPGYVNPLSDRVARHVGDILTIEVKEESLAEYSANTTTARSSKGSFSPGFVFDIIERVFRGFTTSTSSETKGDGKTTHKNKVTTKMSAVVKQVMPNGNLLVEGHRSLTTNKDTETIVLTGIVRPFDIGSDNIVESTRIAELTLALAGKGQIQDKQKKGILSTLLDWLF